MINSRMRFSVSGGEGGPSTGFRCTARRLRPGCAAHERWQSELVRIEDYGVRGIEYLLGPFAQSLWDRGPAAFAEAYALVQSEAHEAQQLRAAKARQAEAAEADEARADFLTAAAQTHERWRRSEP